MGGGEYQNSRWKSRFRSFALSFITAAAVVVVVVVVVEAGA